MSFPPAPLCQCGHFTFVHFRIVPSCFHFASQSVIFVYSTTSANVVFHIRAFPDVCVMLAIHVIVQHFRSLPCLIIGHYGIFSCLCPIALWSVSCSIISVGFRLSYSTISGIFPSFYVPSFPHKIAFHVLSSPEDSIFHAHIFRIFSIFSVGLMFNQSFLLPHFPKFRLIFSHFRKIPS